MFFASIATLPTFGIDNESERDNLVRELLEENGDGDFQEERGNQDLVVQQEGKISGNGESSTGRKKACGC